MRYFFACLFFIYGLGNELLCNEVELINVLKRVAGNSDLSGKIIFNKIKTNNSNKYFQHYSNDGVLYISGSDNVSLCRGFYDYMKRNGCGLFTWTGSSLQIPEYFPNREKCKVISPFENHYYLNVCTFGYSMPYWDWKRWEKEIDWMALHGINMPLALVGYEAIMLRVFRKLGLTDEEINHYFVGPAHLPWMRMGNISGIDGPLNDDWHKKQINLQHRILKRMRKLDMLPICPAFAGFVPKEIKRLYPDVNIIETRWNRAFYNWMLSPDEELFKKIGSMFICEWEKEFGKCDYYLVDSFNEMDIPFPDKENPERYEMAALYGKNVYESIKSANPDAVWVMQGWMFGYQRDIWDYKTLEALVSDVPDDNMLLLDLAADYNKYVWNLDFNCEYYKGFFNKKWVYSVIPNMGGKVAMTGILDFYANGHLEILNSPNKGRLVAHGMAPEGIENNEVVYELISDAGWSDKRIDINQWLKSYSVNRYGKATDKLMEAWNFLLESVYGTFSNQPRFNWQFRPGRRENGSVNINDNYFKGIECFVEAADDLSDSPLFITDLSEMTAHYLGGKAEIIIKQINNEYLSGDTIKANFLQSRFETVMLGMDILLRCHPLLNLDRWLEYARESAVNEEQRKQYETNARRIVTIWGPPVDDYSARIWGGTGWSILFGKMEKIFREPYFRHRFSYFRMGISVGRK